MRTHKAFYRYLKNKKLLTFPISAPVSALRRTLWWWAGVWWACPLPTTWQGEGEMSCYWRNSSSRQVKYLDISHQSLNLPFIAKLYRQKKGDRKRYLLTICRYKTYFWESVFLGSSKYLTNILQTNFAFEHLKVNLLGDLPSLLKLTFFLFYCLQAARGTRLGWSPPITPLPMWRGCTGTAWASTPR